jgi:hypothetical protein
MFTKVSTAYAPMVIKISNAHFFMGGGGWVGRGTVVNTRYQDHVKNGILISADTTF